MDRTRPQRTPRSATRPTSCSSVRWKREPQPEAEDDATEVEEGTRSTSYRLLEQDPGHRSVQPVRPGSRNKDDLFFHRCADGHRLIAELSPRARAEVQTLSAPNDDVLMSRPSVLIGSPMHSAAAPQRRRRVARDVRLGRVEVRQPAEIHSSSAQAQGRRSSSTSGHRPRSVSRSQRRAQSKFRNRPRRPLGQDHRRDFECTITRRARPAPHPASPRSGRAHIKLLHPLHLHGRVQLNTRPRAGQASGTLIGWGAGQAVTSYRLRPR